MHKMEFTLKQAKLLVEAFGGDEESTLTVVATPTLDGEALSAYSTDYPEEGSYPLGATHEAWEPDPALDGFREEAYIATRIKEKE